MSGGEYNDFEGIMEIIDEMDMRELVRDIADMKRHGEYDDITQAVVKVDSEYDSKILDHLIARARQLLGRVLFHHPLEDSVEENENTEGVDKELPRPIIVTVQGSNMLVNGEFGIQFIDGVDALGTFIVDRRWGGVIEQLGLANSYEEAFRLVLNRVGVTGGHVRMGGSR